MKKKQEMFNPDQIQIINNASAMAEELVSNFYKMSASQWLHRKYDIKTIIDLNPDEIVQFPFAQVVRYEGKKKNTVLGSGTYDFYKICLQDHSILAALKQSPDMILFPFILYIVTHELIHIVRFSKFLQSFDASDKEKLAEETRVHEITRKVLSVLSTIRVSGLDVVLKFYNKFQFTIEDLRNQ